MFETGGMKQKHWMIVSSAKLGMLNCIDKGSCDGDLVETWRDPNHDNADVLRNAVSFQRPEVRNLPYPYPVPTQRTAWHTEQRLFPFFQTSPSVLSRKVLATVHVIST